MNYGVIEQKPSNCTKNSAVKWNFHMFTWAKLVCILILAYRVPAASVRLTPTFFGLLGDPKNQQSCCQHLIINNSQDDISDWTIVYVW